MNFQVKSAHETKIILTEAEMSIAAWVNQHSRKAGKYTDTLPSTEFTFYPMIGNRLRIGVVAIKKSQRFYRRRGDFLGYI